MIIRTLNILVLVILVSSCATSINFKPASHRFLSPETSGTRITEELSGSIAIQAQSTQKIVVSRYYDWGGFGSTLKKEETIEESQMFQFSTHLGIFAHSDIAIQLGGSSPTTFIYKYQFLGNHRNDFSEQMSASVWIGRRLQGEDKNISSENFDGERREKFSSEMDLKGFEIGFSIGKRVSNTTLLYSNIFYANDTVESKIKAENKGEFDLNGKHQSYHINLGAQFERDSTSLAFEAGVSNSEWSGSESVDQTALTFGVQAAYQF